MKKNIKVILAVVGLVVVGGIVALSVGKPNGIRVTEGPKYQYQVISPEDIIVEYSGLKPDKKLSAYDGNYVTDTSVYLSDRVGIYLDENHFEAQVGEYVNYVDVSFKWNVSDKDLYLLSRRGLDVSPSLFEGSIAYTDGYVGSIDAEEVELKIEGNKLKVYINFRGNDSVGYEIEIPEMWEDMNLNEESQEDIESWYEGLGGDSSQVGESSATEITDWVVNVSDSSNREFYSQVDDMIETYNMWVNSLSDETLSDMSLANFDEGGSKTEIGEDITYNVSYKEDSEWYLTYGNSSLSDVYKEAGITEYGIHCSCYCTYNEYNNGFEQAISDYFNLGFDYSNKENNRNEAWLTHAIKKIPLSEHSVRQLSMEEVREYILAVYMHYGDGISPFSQDGLKYYEEPHILNLYGIDSVDSLIEKFSKYYTKPIGIKDVYNSYKDANTLGYSGSIFDFYNLSESELDSIMLKVITNKYNSLGWEIHDENIIPIIESLGGSIPEYAIIVDDGDDYKPELELVQPDLSNLIN